MASIRWTAEMLDAKLEGAPKEGEFRKQLIAANSNLGAHVYGLLHADNVLPSFEPKQMIAIALLTSPARKATELDILETFCKTPHFERIQESGTSEERAIMKQVVKDVESCLDENRYHFDVDFPPNGYRELRSRPGNSNKEAQQRWYAKVGLEMAEEEDSPSTRYSYDYAASGVEFAEDFDEEWDEHRCEEGGLTSYVYVLPPGQENIIFAGWYQDLPETEDPLLLQAGCLLLDVRLMIARHVVRLRNAAAWKTFGDLPIEPKEKILRYVLVLPGKIRVTASAEDDGTMPDGFFSQLDVATYTFSMSVKIPKYLVTKNGEQNWKRPTTSSLIVPTSSSRFAPWAKNFTILDDLSSTAKTTSKCSTITWTVPRERLEDVSCAGTQLTHRWLELMGAPYARDRCQRY